MGEKHSANWLIPACGLVMIVSAVACSTERRDQTSNENQPSAASDRQRGQERPSVTLVGCVQQGDGRNDFILTEDNTARDTSGTTGSTPSAEKQRQQAAAKSYRLTDADEDLHQHVGKQVRVIGTLVEPSDLPTTHGTAGSEPEKGEPKIHERDLAKVDVGAIETVADSCGSSEAAKPAR